MNGSLPALAAGAIAFLSVGMCLIGFFTRLDSRVVLTYPETFSDLQGVRDAFLNRLNLSVADNPANIWHVRYPAALETLPEYEDLVRRGLISSTSGYVPYEPYNPSLLRQLMRFSWCSTGLPPGGYDVPANRTPGCQCIADAYVDFVQSALAVNSTFVSKVNGINQTFLNVALDIRQRVGDRAIRCWDVRQVTRSVSCGRVCTSHVVGLAMFADIVLFLVCASYVAFFTLTWDRRWVKALIVGVGALLCVIYVVHDAAANSLSVAGIFVCLFYITWTLDFELDRDNEDVVGKPHQLSTVLFVNLPLILSAHIIQIAVSNYGRDLWAFAGFGFVGALLGIVLQARFFAF